MVLVLLSACGGGSLPVAAPPVTPSAAPIDGRWSFSTTSQTVPFASVVFSGVLSTNGTAVTGVGQVQFFLMTGSNASACVQPTTVTVQGTLNSARHLSLSSSTVNGTVFTIDADIPTTYPAVDSPAGGITTAVGSTGTCAVATSPAFAYYSSSLTGTYVGSLQQVVSAGPVDTAIPSVSMALSESDPDPLTGESSIAGSAKLTFPTCSVVVPIARTRVGAQNTAVLLYPTPSPPLVAVFALQPGQVMLNIWYEGSDCKPTAVIAPAPGAGQPPRWSGTLARQ